MVDPKLRLPDKLALQGKKILVRVDYNVPMVAGKLGSTVRIDRTLELIRSLLKGGAQLTLVSHLGRPQEGQFDASFSLQAVVPYLEQQLQQQVIWCPTWPKIKPTLANGQLALAENVRFLDGEQAGSTALARQMAADYDLLILESFATAHRQHASNYTLVDHFKNVYLGPLFFEELAHINQLQHCPTQPAVAIVGGAKMATKIDLIMSLMPQVDHLLLGGALANTFLVAAGYDIGSSLYEPDRVAQAKQLLQLSQKPGFPRITLPVDVLTLSANETEVLTVPVAEIGQGAAYDIGPKTIAEFAEIIQHAETLLWNGPLGWFERDEFSQGSLAIAAVVADSACQKLLGGGDTLAVVEQSGLPQSLFGFTSTGGGAFLAALTADGLPILRKLTKDIDEGS